MGPRRTEPAWSWAAVVAITAVVFALDLATPLGVAEWMLYVPAVVVCKLATWRPLAPLAVAGVTSALIVAVYVFSEHRSEAVAQLSLVNRGIAVTTLLLLGAMGRQFVRYRTRLADQGWREAGQIALSARMAGELSPGAWGRRSGRCTSSTTAGRSSVAPATRARANPAAAARCSRRAKGWSARRRSPGACSSSTTCPAATSTCARVSAAPRRGRSCSCRRVRTAR
jgi:hypothetical protein